MFLNYLIFIFRFSFLNTLFRWIVEFKKLRKFIFIIKTVMMRELIYSYSLIAELMYMLAVLVNLGTFIPVARTMREII